MGSDNSRGKYLIKHYKTFRLYIILRDPMFILPSPFVSMFICWTVLKIAYLRLYKWTILMLDHAMDQTDYDAFMKYIKVSSAQQGDNVFGSICLFVCAVMLRPCHFWNTVQGLCVFVSNKELLRSALH